MAASWKGEPSSAVTRQTSPSNHGIVDKGGIKMAYGKDSSFQNGSANDERGQSGFGGGDTNLSHSISGSMATK